MERRCWVNFQCRGVLLVWMIVGQGPIALAVGAGGGCLDIFSLIYLFSFLSPSLWETARYRLKYCLKGPLNPKQPTNQMDYDWKVHDDLCGSDHCPIILNNIGQNIDEHVSRWKLNKANWAQFQTLSTARLLEDTVRKPDDPIESFASFLINIAEETVPKTATKSKKAKKPWFTDDCKTAIKQRKGALRQFNNRPTHDNLNNYRIFRAKARRTIKESKKKSWKQYVSKFNSRNSIKKVWDMVRKIQ